MVEDSQYRQRSRTFGAAAADYDRFRPGYPVSPFIDLLRRASDGVLVEVGAGTGIATRHLLARAGRLICIEPDPGMVEVLSKRVAGFRDVEVVVDTFEEWASRAREGSVDGLVSAEAWHWTDPVSRWRLASRVLRDGASIDLVWNLAEPDFPWPRHVVADVYQRAGLGDERLAEVSARRRDGGQEGRIWPGISELQRIGLTCPVESMTRWERRVSLETFLGGLATTSAQLMLSSSERAIVWRELECALEGYFQGGDIAIPMVTRVQRAIRLARGKY